MTASVSNVESALFFWGGSSKGENPRARFLVKGENARDLPTPIVQFKKLDGKFDVRVFC